MFEALVGASVLASAAIALFFLCFWQQTRDRLFLIFALAFAVFAVNRILLSALDDQSEAQTAVYLARALTFALIALATGQRPGFASATARRLGRPRHAAARAVGEFARNTEPLSGPPAPSAGPLPTVPAGAGARVGDRGQERGRA